MKLCQIYNGASSYRESIYLLLDQSFDTDWFFGSCLGDIKLMDTTKLKGRVYNSKNVSILGNTAYWQKGVIKVLFKPYTHYIIAGDERCLSNWLFLFLSFLFPKKKIYFWSHGPYGREGFLKRIIQKVYFNLVEGTFLYGDYARNIMIKRGFNPETLYVVHNSLAYDQQKILRESLKPSNIYVERFGNNNPVIIVIGRLNTRKNLPMLIHAISELKKRGENYNVVFIGEGEQKKALIELADEVGIIHNIWFFGACYDEKTNAELLYNADLCVLPGDIGLTAIHSLMFGVPVISHNAFPFQGPEFEAIIEGKTGSFFEHNNNDSLVDTISKWFKEQQLKREEVRIACYNEIDKRWNPYFQIAVFKKVLTD